MRLIMITNSNHDRPWPVKGRAPGEIGLVASAEESREARADAARAMNLLE